VIKFEKIKAGDVLYQKSRVGMGNTTMTRDAVYQVYVKSVDPETRTAVVSWNSNPAKQWSARSLEKLYRKKPEVKSLW